MHIKRVSTAKGRPPPFVTVRAVVPAKTQGTTHGGLHVQHKVRSASASAITFKMQLQFNLSRPVLSANLQLRTQKTGDVVGGGRAGDVHRWAPGSRSVSAASAARRAGTPEGRRPESLTLPMPVSATQTHRTLMVRRSARQRREQAIGHFARVSGEQCATNRRRFERALRQAHGGASARGFCDDDSDGDGDGGGVPELTRQASMGTTHPAAHGAGNGASSSGGGGADSPSLPSIAADSSSSVTSYGDRQPSEHFRSQSRPRSRMRGLSIGIGSSHGLPPDPKQRPLTTSGAPGYNHERYRKCAPAMRQHLDRVSSSFRVVTTPRHHSDDDAPSVLLSGGSLRHADLSKVFLMPTSADADADASGDVTPEKFLRREPPDRTSGIPVKGPGESPVPGALGPGTSSVGAAGEAQQEDVEISLADTTSGARVPGVVVSLPHVLDKEKSALKPARQEHSAALLPSDQKKLSRYNSNSNSNSNRKTSPRTKHTVQSKPDPSGKQRTGSVQSGSSSEHLSRPSSARHWQTKTWVDDATVTSDEHNDVRDDENDRAEHGATPRDPNSEVSKPKAAGPEKTSPEVMGDTPQSKAAAFVKKPDPTVACVGAPWGSQAAETAAGKAGEQGVGAAGEPVEVMSLADLKRSEQTLPDFICPRSEQKSRECAVMDWLETTSRHWAMKTAPLL